MTRDPEEQTRQKRRLLYQVSSRIVACAASAVAALLMAFNRETTVYGGVEIDVDYTAASAFKFFIVGNAVVSIYSLVSLVFFLSRNARAGLLHVLDLTAMALAMAVAASAAAIAHVGKYGEPKAGWVSVCGYFPNFCHRTGLSLVLCFVGFISCFLSTATMHVAGADPQL
ncbi:unnamed protein product [Spirodela intermedia]|uniref:CASP-like protein n=1 Tax=Spirodela intermedia TaxID=51605 RepID=A0A7I8KRQ8_SPIIN|nr:unnamed protein product [Spirodela intermedia]